jgi:hypothetical protein
MSEQPLRIMIAVPCYSGYPKAEHSHSVRQLTMLNTSPRIEWIPAYSLSCPCLPRVRNALIAKALAANCTHVLFIDADIAFDPRDVIRMIGHDTEIVAAVPQKRSQVWNEPPRLAIAPNGLAIMPALGLAEPPEPKLPMALTLIKTSLIHRMREQGLIQPLIYVPLTDDEQPFMGMYFGYEAVPVQEGYEEYEVAKRLGIEGALSEDGEDHFFCRRAAQAGARILIDIEVELKHYEGNVCHDYSFKKLFASDLAHFKDLAGNDAGGPVAGKLSVMVPTRGRPALAMRAVRSLLENAVTDIEIVVGLDSDDDTVETLMRGSAWIGYEDRVRFCSAARAPTLGALWNRLYNETTGDIIGMLTDDCVVSEPGWDMKVRRALGLMPESIGFAFPKDPLHGANFGTQFFFTRETGDLICDAQGYVFEPWYPFWFNDTALNEIGDMAGLKRAMDWSIDIPEGRGATQSLVNADVPFWAEMFDYTRPMRVAAAAALLARVNGKEPSEEDMADRAQWCAGTVAHLHEARQWGREAGEPGERYLAAKEAAEAFMAPEPEPAFASGAFPIGATSRVVPLDA